MFRCSDNSSNPLTHQKNTEQGNQALNTNHKFWKKDILLDIRKMQKTRGLT